MHLHGVPSNHAPNGALRYGASHNAPSMVFPLFPRIMARLLDDAHCSHPSQHLKYMSLAATALPQ